MKLHGTESKQWTGTKDVYHAQFALKLQVIWVGCVCVGGGGGEGEKLRTCTESRRGVYSHKHDTGIVGSGRFPTAPYPHSCPT